MDKKHTEKLADALRRIGYSTEWHDGRLFTDAPERIVNAFTASVLSDAQRTAALVVLYREDR